MSTVTSIASRRAISPQEGWGEFRMVTLADLKVDQSYQRTASQRRIERIARNFDMRRFGTLDLSERDNGDLFVVDGLHRKESAIIRGLKTAPAMVQRCNDPKEDARRFVEQDERRHLSSAVVFKAQLKYKDTIAMMLDELFRRYKFDIPDPKIFGYNNKDNEIRAIGTFEKVAKLHGEEYCNSILYVQRHAWKGESHAMKRTMILGLSRCFETYEPGHAALVKAIRARKVDAFELISVAEGRAYHSEKKISVATSLGDLLGAMVK